MQVCGTTRVGYRNATEVVGAEDQKWLYWEEDEYKRTGRGHLHDLLSCKKTGFPIRSIGKVERRYVELSFPTS